ncbi:MAG TPA: DUF1566 domain-containing protein [Caldimonas sp.]|nr:DUF1566 domain-containing protein [Caldimonas sp.]HEX4234169.1 DUF1566 domain-containing protein [Caldimonas sp.]
MTLSRGAALGSRIAAFALLAFAAGASPAQGRFVISADGQEVTDSTTRLIWRRCAEGMHWDGKTCSGKAATFTYKEAKKVADDAHDQVKFWRIPDRDELVGIVDKTAKKKPLIDAKAFPGTPKNLFWAVREGHDDDLNAWLVNFSNGKVRANIGQKKFPLRLVRATP